VGYWSAERAGLRALNINMNPLVIAGRVGEYVHLLLCDRSVVRVSKMFADQTLEFINTFDN
jgi:hypothetical protein